MHCSDGPLTRFPEMSSNQPRHSTKQTNQPKQNSMELFMPQQICMLDELHWVVWATFRTIKFSRKAGKHGILFPRDFAISPDDITHRNQQSQSNLQNRSYYWMWALYCFWQYVIFDYKCLTSLWFVWKMLDILWFAWHTFGNSLSASQMLGNILIFISNVW